MKYKKQHAVSPKRILGIVLALVVFFILLTSVLGLASKYTGIRKHIGALKEEQASFAAKREHLRSTNEYLQTPEGQERELRQKYNLIKPGEGVIIITEPTEAPKSEEKRSMVGKWWDTLLRGLGIRE